MSVWESPGFSRGRGFKEVKKKLGLDFDDAYQYQVARERDLKIVTMDKDFQKIGSQTTGTPNRSKAAGHVRAVT